MRIRPVLFAAALTALVASPAPGTIHRDPVKVRLAGSAPVLRAGEPTTLSFEVVAAASATVSGLEVSSGSLAAPFARRAEPLRIGAGSPLRFDVAVLPSEAPDPLVVRLDVDGKPFERSFALASLLDGERARRSAVIRVADAPRPTVVPPGGGTPPAWALAQPDTARSGATPLGAQSRQIRVHGRFAYHRTDGPLIGVDKIWVRIYDEDTGTDDLQVGGFSDAYGYYDFTFYWTPDGGGDDQPDLYAKFETNSPVVIVQDAGFEIEYSWMTPTHWNFTGSDLDLGTVVPANQDVHGALHIYTNLQRNWLWYQYWEGYSPGQIDVQWPDGSSGAWYNSVFNEIHVSSQHTWNESTQAHEYGHYFMDMYSTITWPSYCNGYCDAPDDCGHCMWCEENSDDAYNEGWPNWIAHVQTSSWASDYGLAALSDVTFSLNAERVDDCAPGEFHSPFLTEGFTTSILQDIWDSAMDQDPNGLGQGDTLALGTDEIFDVVDIDQPDNLFSFLNAFRARFPQFTWRLWQVAYNNRWNVDTQNPGQPTALTSTSHTPNQPSPISTLQFTWNASTDDWSGVGSYDVFLHRPSPQTDSAWTVTGTSAATAPQIPGSYLFTVRPRDRSGRVGPQASVGPYILETPDPADLEVVYATGWAQPFVARPAADAATNNVPNPTSLAGNAAGTYFNGAVTNQGQTSPPFAPPAPCWFHVDGALVGTSMDLSLQPGQVAHLINRGPFTVRGGRHHAGIRLDVGNAWIEASEANNAWGHPWVWSPLSLMPAQRVRRGAPPGATDGWWTVRDGSPLYSNCDGLRMTLTGFQHGTDPYWHATWIAADSDTADFDLRQHTTTTSVTTGFDSSLGQSLRGPGCLDLVVANRHNVLNAMDVGVGNATGDLGTYVAKQVYAPRPTTFDFEDSVTVTFPDSEYVVLREVSIGAADLGPVTAVATGNPADGPFHIALLNPGFTTGGLTGSAIGSFTSDPTGRARVAITASVEGYYCLLLYRDPRDGRSSRQVVLEVERTPSDLVATAPPQWHAPLVPRPAPDAQPAAVPLPDTLAGDVAGTWFNWRGMNESPSMSPPGVEVLVGVDGGPLLTGSIPSVLSGANFYVLQAGPATVRGGRHTLSLAYDAARLVEELSDANNGWGEQFVWSPLELAQGADVTRAAPPDRTGGWAGVTSGEPLYFNCDGVRTPVFSNGQAQWGGIGVMPGASSDVDLRLHEVAPGTKDGFGASLGVSAWGPGECDYLLVDFAATARRAFDVGVVNANGTESYTAQAISSGVHALPPGGTIGPFNLGGGKIFALPEVVLSAGAYRVRLVINSPANVDLGVAVHGAGPAVQSRSGALAAAWLAGPGEPEEFVFSAGETGSYCFPVWKADPSDLGIGANYQLEITTVTLDSPVADRPARTFLAPAAPSPFRTATVLAFDLAGDADLRVEVFDLAGARIRTLAAGRWQAGRHRVEWDGRGGDGRALSAGVYIVRLQAGAHVAHRKVVRMP
jgi:hypothetical protein